MHRYPLETFVSGCQGRKPACWLGHAEEVAQMEKIWRDVWEGGHGLEADEPVGNVRGSSEDGAS
jgi:hypothetical protein